MDQEIKDLLEKKDVPFPGTNERNNTVLTSPEQGLPKQSEKRLSVEVRALRKMTAVFYEGFDPHKLTKKDFLALKKLAGDGELKPTNEGIHRALMLNGLETNMPIVNALKEEYAGFALKLVSQIEKEYDCKTPSEKVTAQIAALAHARALQYEEKLRDCFGIEYHSGQKNGFFSLMSKEVD
jgi:hypothetical protein